MFKPKIRVSLELYPGDFREVAKEIGEGFIRDALRPLDLPSLNADPFSRLICTDMVTIDRVKKSRREIVEIISEAITEALLEQMEAKDTEMGYSRRELD